MPTMNILGMPEEARRKLIEQAKGELMQGDDRLARQLAVDAAQQFAAQLRHYADEVLTELGTMRKSLAAGVPACGDVS